MDPIEGWEEVKKELEKSNALLEASIKQRSDWKLAMRQGLVTGLGSVLGATLLVSILIWILKPLQQLDVLKPSLERIANQLERGGTRR